MSSLSLLPAQYSYIELWAARLFLLLAFLTIGPWLLLIAYDFLLYLFRVAAFELPYLGGRARSHLLSGPSLPRGVSGAVDRDQDDDKTSAAVGHGAGTGTGTGTGTEVDGEHGGSSGRRRMSRGVNQVLLEEEREMRSWEVLEDSEREGS